MTKCPVCGGPMHDQEVRNSLSRALADTYICNDCGTREAMLDMRIQRVTERRIILRHDLASGIMLVVEDEPGFEPFGRHPQSESFANKYCDAWNSTTGLSDRDVDDIATSSMFGRWKNF